MKVVITGTSGYIGSALQKHLLLSGFDVTAIGRTESKNTEQKVRYSFIKANITKPLDFNLNDRCEIMIHLASANDIDCRNPETAVMVNALGIRNCLEFCAKNKINKFIYFSTFQVYGNLEGEISEQTPLQPVNDYGISHYFAEEFVKMYARTQNINYLILRPNNIYGAPANIAIDRWSLVPGCFCKEAIETSQITLNSSGKQIRDFCNLNDIVELTSLFCNNFEEYKNNILNIFSGYQYSIIEIAELVKEVFENQFKQACSINVLSEHPIVPDRYTVKNNITHDFYKYGGKQSMIEEIKKTFTILKNL